MDRISLLIKEMIRYDAGDPHRIQHFIKVHNFARTIGYLEQLDDRTQEILETAAVVHDIGILKSLEKYGDCNGKHQELEGPPEAKPMLEALGYDTEAINRVCYLVGHHHTYDHMDGMDYQILVEADFLVNLHEDHSPAEAKQRALKQIFKTKSGTDICKTMFGLA